MADREAMFFERREAGKVMCGLCAHHCLILPGKRGICGVRENRDGTLFSLNYGRVVAAHVDPVEKKPLFHFLPGSTSFSIASVGCNFKCGHCQNYTISQYPKDHGGEIAGDEITPNEVVKAALNAGCNSISYTYTEPTIFFEFALETAKLARKRKLKNIFVSNGFTSEAAARAIAPYLDGNNIDLKSFSDGHYKKVCGARLQPVLDTIKLMKSLGVWIELTTLVIPGLNDTDAEFESIAGFIASVDTGIPWHVSRFHPAWKMMSISPTPVETLMRARAIGYRNELAYVYIGNVPGVEGEDTLCPSCGSIAIKRRGYSVRSNLASGGKCPSCKTRIQGVW
ncbi:MAG: AmmeMemoRadiSam system radical SAM enzyme [Nitrospirae bacterium]|nr:AmmeMemoRadiSam system radical SAM enzyme [Nitrospirota bacterium]